MSLVILTCALYKWLSLRQAQPSTLAPVIMAVALAEQHWQRLLANYSKGSIEIVGTLVFHLIAFYVPCAVYASLEVLFPAFSDSHKI